MLEHILFLPLIAAVMQSALGGRRSACLTVISLILCFSILTYCFLIGNKGVELVLMHSHPAMPNAFKFGAVWGNHEGSMLLWILLLALPSPFFKTTEARQVSGWLITGALIFLYFTANPFLPALGNEFQKQFNGLNPLLQDIALMVHPPVLYVGYTLAAVPFCYLVGYYLLADKPISKDGASGYIEANKTLSKYSRNYTQAAWSFLTVGIVLGSWWAYRELGWGGWWFWDPVENASLIPWLLLTALMHSNISTAKFNLFPVWTSLLTVLAFSSAIFGMFITRSGLLVSVHAFASDPTRGTVLFGYFCLVFFTGLYAVYMQWKSKNNTLIPPAALAFTSRENFILLNNILMLTSALIILIATLWPLLDKEISIGAPFYNEAVLPIFLLVFPLMAIAVLLPWRKGVNLTKYKKMQLLALGCAAALGGIMMLWLQPLKHQIMAIATTAVLMSLIASLWFVRLKSISLLLGHAGMAVSVLGMLLVALFSQQKIMAMAIDDSIVANVQIFTLRKMEQGAKDNYFYRQATFVTESKQLNVQNRLYPNNQMNTTEVAILPNWLSHYYLVLGDREQDKFTVHLYYYPAIRLIWLGGVIMAIGGLWGIVLRWRK